MCWRDHYEGPEKTQHSDVGFGLLRMIFISTLGQVLDKTHLGVACREQTVQVIVKASREGKPSICHHSGTFDPMN